MTEQLNSGLRLVEVTWKRALKVWWSITWRMFLISLLIGVVLGIILVILTGLTGIRPKTSSVIIQVAGLLISIPVGVWVFKIVLNKKFSDFRIALIEK